MSGRARLSVRCVAVALVAVATAACGGADPARVAVGPDPGEVVAQVASYEVLANRDQRFMAALAGNGDGLVVSFGTARMAFSYLGTREKPVDPPQAKSTVTATFLPVAGSTALPPPAGPRLTRPSEGVGVYVAEPVRFDAPGFWGVTIAATLEDGRTVEDSVPFEVHAEARIPAPGDRAPRTANPVAGAPGVDPAAIDSRASDAEDVPDAALHTTSVAAALLAGKPLLVVVSSPVYCVSQFCGPITDSVARLAAVYGDRMSFVHLEVWEDYDNKVVSPSASEWIAPRGGRGDTQEPWVFTVGSDGLIKQRFDNVIDDAGLESAVKALLTR